jgi:hypothetical protein
MTSEDAISGQIDAWHAKIRAERWFTLDPWRLTDSPYCSNEPAHVGGRPRGQTVKPRLCVVCGEGTRAKNRTWCNPCIHKQRVANGWNVTRAEKRKAALASGE